MKIISFATNLDFIFIVKSSYKTEEIIQVEPEKAKSLRAKFENWNADDERGNRKNSTEDNELAQFERDSTKNLRAMFESIQNEPKKIERPKPRVNRFVVSLINFVSFDTTNFSI